jgi:UDP-N-acetylglucosamine--N-acetylmuramyl-(pentapeptide) pyrophosphoryl-undecaprenol N-acetylglucosamine transferase
VAAGAAFQVADATLTATLLRREVLPLLRQPGQLEQMGRIARGLGRPDAARDLAELVEQAAGLR